MNSDNIVVKMKLNYFPKHDAQTLISGFNLKRSIEIDFLHFMHKPKSLSFVIFSDCSSCDRRALIFRSLASKILLLLMASIRETRPMAQSGSTGAVNCLISSSLAFCFSISEYIIWISSFFSAFLLTKHLPTRFLLP